MKIYDSAIAPNPRRLRIFVAEKGLNIPYEQVDILKGGGRTPEFLKKNPAGGVPVLELDDGTCLSESVAICRYLEGLHPEPNLMGRDYLEQAVIEMWQRRIDLNLFATAGRGFQHTNPMVAAIVGKQFPDYGAAQMENVKQQLAWLDAQLKGKEFLAGPRYTIADISVLVAVDFAAFAGVKADPSLKELARWHQTVSSRPSAKA
jgi:glutathione S-transferase